MGDAEILQRHGIFRIVNCQAETSENFFEDVPGFEYLRFPVASWASAPDISTPAGVLLFFDPLFRWVDAAMDGGRNVLIHCLAGCHRAGATGVATLMYLTGQSSTEIVKQI